MKFIENALQSCINKRYGINIGDTEITGTEYKYLTKTGNGKKVFYIKDIFFPYIAIYGLESSANEESEYHFCTSLKFQKLSDENKQHYKAAKERLTSLHERIRDEKIDEDDLEEGGYKVEFAWPVQDPNFSLDELLTKTEGAIRKFVDVDTNMATIITLWIAFTWTIWDHETSPLLIIKNDDDHYDSKFALLKLIMHLACGAVRASAVNMRTLLEGRMYIDHTVLFDDPSAIRNRETHNLLINSRSRSDATKVTRNNNKLQSYNTFGAKAFVCDGDIPKSLMHTGITIHLGVQHVISRPSQMAASDTKLLVNICNGLRYFAIHYHQLLGEAKPKFPDYLSNIERENWEPLFNIAMIAGDTWVQKVIQAAQAVSSTLHQDSITSQMLVTDAYNVVKNQKTIGIHTKTLISLLCRLTDRPWATYNRGDNITSGQLAKLFKKHNFSSKDIRLDSSDGNPVKKGYEKRQILKAHNAITG